MSWIEVCRYDDLPAGGAVQADVDGSILAIVRTEAGSVHAIDDECTHGRVSLSEGDVDGCQIECWLHGSRFDLITGEPTCLPATIPVRVYAVRVEDGLVYVDLTGTEATVSSSSGSTGDEKA